LPTIEGSIVLEGDSGLGKSSFLRHRVLRSRRAIAYLTASRCAEGVPKAIGKKLPIPARDSRFLRQLIDRGALGLAIDGLNEVSAETRARIVEFVERNPRVDVILATQPMEWTPPAGARTYQLLPLDEPKIRAFLRSRVTDLPAETKLRGADYEAACDAFLDEELRPDRPAEERDAIRRVLSNPMDLTVVGQILAQGGRPDLFHLQEQQYRIMAEDYQRTHAGMPFPLGRVSEEVYRRRLDDVYEFPADAFPEAVPTLAKYRLIVPRPVADRDGASV
jgi:hypothetical protein